MLELPTSTYEGIFETTKYNMQNYILLLPGAELSLIAESFGLLNDLLLHFSRSWTQAVQFFFSFAKCRLVLSSYLYLGLPCDLLVRGFQLNIFLTVLVSDILCT